MAQLLVPQEVPETCYISEAALWIAFGRVPDFHNYEEHADSRALDERIYEFGHILDVDLGYHEQEFRSVGFEIDFERYEACRYDRMHRTGSEHMEWYEWHVGRIKPNLDASPEDANALMSHLEALREQYSKEAIEYDWRAAQESLLDNHIDRARSALYDKLSGGHLIARGFERPNSHVEPIKWISIEAREWSFRHLDWDLCEMPVRGKLICELQVQFADLLHVFPRPIIEGREGRVSIFPGVAILENDEVSEPNAAQRRQRGRLPKQNGLVRDGLQRWLSDRVRRGDILPKKEALWAEAAEFARVAYAETVKRSTAQAYLSPLLDAMPENVPEIPAGK